MVNIVVPVDFSDRTDFLVDSAVKFAKQNGGKLFLIHVASLDIGFTISDLGYQYLPDVEQNEINEELGRLHEIENRVKGRGIDCEHLLKQGNASEIILDYATQKNASYIVIGSHGRSGIYDIFVGSLTKEITKKSKIPILVFPMHD